MEFYGVLHLAIRRTCSGSKCSTKKENSMSLKKEWRWSRSWVAAQHFPLAFLSIVRWAEYIGPVCEESDKKEEMDGKGQQDSQLEGLEHTLYYLMSAAGFSLALFRVWCEHLLLSLSNQPVFAGWWGGTLQFNACDASNPEIGIFECHSAEVGPGTVLPCFFMFFT